MNLRLSLCLASALLITGMLVTILPALSKPPSNEAQEMIDLDRFVLALKDRGAKEVPLGETESVRDAVADILKFNRGEYWAVPLRNGGELSVYLAYWRPGRQNLREVAFHTPDHCWVNAGWRLQPPQQNLFLPESFSPAIVDAKQRVFSAGGATAYVAYWHLFGGKIIDYGKNAVPSNWSLVSAIWRVGLDQRKAQWFIRVHSSVPLSQCKDEPALVALTQLVEILAPGGDVLRME